MPALRLAHGWRILLTASQYESGIREPPALSENFVVAPPRRFLARPSFILIGPENLFKAWGF
jgi:hypothetical protein